tara:strand:+ start:619 stop:816 length:198 start_codon:yes stop_codon:yes gene_type:complete
MYDNNLYSPLQLEKLCANIIVKNIWDENESLFNMKLDELNLPDILKHKIFDRYLLIKHILKHEKI